MSDCCTNHAANSYLYSLVIIKIIFNFLQIAIWDEDFSDMCCADWLEGSQMTVLFLCLELEQRRPNMLKEHINRLILSKNRFLALTKNIFIFFVTSTFELTKKSWLKEITLSSFLLYANLFGAHMTLSCENCYTFSTLLIQVNCGVIL